MKKFELTEEFITNIHGVKLYRIKALKGFSNVLEGELGGYIEKESNLDQEGSAWVYDSAQIYDDAQVYGNAWAYGDAQVYGNAKVYGDAQVYGNAEVCGNAQVYGNTWVCGDAQVYGNARVYGDAHVCGNARVDNDGDYITVKGFGSQFRTTTFFKTKDDLIGVKCGCFYGTLEQFRRKVEETHGKTKTAKEYLLLAKLIEYKFSKEEDNAGKKWDMLQP